MQKVTRLVWVLTLGAFACGCDQTQPTRDARRVDTQAVSDATRCDIAQLDERWGAEDTLKVLYEACPPPPAVDAFVFLGTARADVQVREGLTTQFVIAALPYLEDVCPGFRKLARELCILIPGAKPCAEDRAARAAELKARCGFAASSLLGREAIDLLPIATVAGLAMFQRWLRTNGLSEERTLALLKAHLAEPPECVRAPRSDACLAAWRRDPAAYEIGTPFPSYYEEPHLHYPRSRAVSKPHDGLEVRVTRRGIYIAEQKVASISCTAATGRPCREADYDIDTNRWHLDPADPGAFAARVREAVESFPRPEWWPKQRAPELVLACDEFVPFGIVDRLFQAVLARGVRYVWVVTVNLGPPFFKRYPTSSLPMKLAGCPDEELATSCPMSVRTTLTKLQLAGLSGLDVMTIPKRRGQYAFHELYSRLVAIKKEDPEQDCVRIGGDPTLPWWVLVRTADAASSRLTLDRFDALSSYLDAAPNARRDTLFGGVLIEACQR